MEPRGAHLRSGENMIDQSPTAEPPSPIVTADLVGAWSLESYVDTIDGAETIYPLGLDPKGLLIYAPDGFMSAQLMRTDSSPLDLGDANAGILSDCWKKAHDFIGYSGMYQFDELTATVFHMPSVSFAPGLIGQRLKRQAKLDCDRLTLTVVTPRVGGGKSVTSNLSWLKLHR
jgi:hypothetical protein